MIARAAATARRAVGAALLLLVVPPTYRLLDGRAVGAIGAEAARANDRLRPMLWSGTLVVLCIALLAGRLVPHARGARWAGTARASLLAVSDRGWVLLCAVVAGVATALFSRVMLHGQPNLFDAMAQLQQARYLAEGQLAGPGGPLAAFWTVQNSLVTPAGWVSHYPPGYTALLAFGIAIHALPLVPVLLAAGAAAATALAAARLLPDRPATARLGALAASLSPLAIAQAGAYMNHVAASCFGALAVWAALVARDRGAGEPAAAAWAVAAGAAVGAAFTVRPLAALVVALVVAVAWAPAGAPALARRSALAALGGLPFAALVAWYNAHFFGAPTRFGYVASQGAEVGLGFHRDPFGNVYGLREAVGFTASDLSSLGMNLLETPLSAVAVVGLFLLVARRLGAGERVLAAWALLPVAANFVYWHHGLFMGPRMLAEAVPAWVLLAAVAAAALVDAVPVAVRAAGMSYSPRVAAGAAAVVACVAALGLAPERLASYGGPWMASTRLALPPAPASGLVFVHGTWQARLAARAASAGLRLDSVETLLRQNPTCDAAHWVDAYEARRSGATTALPPASFEPGAAPAEQLALDAGVTVRVRRGEPATPDCAAQAAADVRGALDVTPLLWQHDLPGAERGGTMYVRDLGPERNALLIARYPARTPLVMTRPPATDRATLVAYADGMRALYGDSQP